MNQLLGDFFLIFNDKLRSQGRKVVRYDVVLDWVKKNKPPTKGQRAKYNLFMKEWNEYAAKKTQE